MIRNGERIPELPLAERGVRRLSAADGPKQALEVGRTRLLVAGVLFSVAFSVIAWRVVDLTVVGGEGRLSMARQSLAQLKEMTITSRADIVDRNGELLASSLPTASVYADPREVLDASDAADKLAGVLPGISRDVLFRRLSSKARFVWIERNLTPNQVFAVNHLGLPGIAFKKDERRVYPHGHLLSHVLGYTDVDGAGISGVERYFDTVLKVGNDPLRLSIDVRMQSFLHNELSASMREFKAKGAAGVVMDAQSGEVLAMVSLPDFDPNAHISPTNNAAFNRVTKGVYEMGSIFKLYTAAMALDSGSTKLTDRYDAREPIRIARFSISDFHAENRWLSVPEIIVHSSNIGSAKMALKMGAEQQQAYLRRFGLLTPVEIELPEIGYPLVPSPWREINTMTISYGHGIAVSPLQAAVATGALVNGGVLKRPTLLARTASAPAEGERVISERTSEEMRGLMHLVVRYGTGSKANVPGYMVGGKTGTADKQSAQGYSDTDKLVTFAGAFPIDNPRYVILATIDEPIGHAGTYNYATAGWVAAPIVGHLAERLGTIDGLIPLSADGDKTMPKGFARAYKIFNAAANASKKQASNETVVSRRVAAVQEVRREAR